MKRDLAAEEAYIQKVLDSAPPLSRDQLDRLAVLFRADDVRGDAA